MNFVATTQEINPMFLTTYQKYQTNGKGFFKHIHVLLILCNYGLMSSENKVYISFINILHVRSCEANLIIWRDFFLLENVSDMNTTASHWLTFDISPIIQ